MCHRQQAMDVIYNTPMINAVKYAPLYQKTFLQALMGLVRSTGQVEATTRDAKLNEILAVDELPLINFRQMVMVSSSLISSAIIIASPTMCDVSRKLKFVPSVDDVTFALHEQ